MNTDEKLKNIATELKSIRLDGDKEEPTPSTILELTETNQEGLKVGKQSNGKKYSVRDNRDRFFFPNEWKKFYQYLKNDKQKITFDLLLGTGARVNEVINVKVNDVDFERHTIILRVTKVKAKKGEKNSKPRIIAISSQLSKKLRGHIRRKGLEGDATLGLLSKPAIHICLKSTLQRIEIKDWYMFSTHNIRKTHGNWLKALGVDGMEICQRLGHDFNTFLHNYGSPDIFNSQDKVDMRNILGDLYDRRLK